jgi:hypothetical protein
MMFPPNSAIQISIAIQSKTGDKLVDFKAAFEGNEAAKVLRTDVEAYSKRFPMPGFESSKLKYKD